MQRSTIINHRQHVGLQKLSALAGITHSMLGPNKSYKFIHDDTSGESALACSCFRVLETLELTCAVGQLVFETAQAHQQVYHTGSGSLLFLAGAWSRAALECLQRGIPLAHIISAMTEGMDVCLEVSEKSSVSTEGLGRKQSHSSEASNLLQATTTRGDPKTPNGKRRLTFSRHLNAAELQPEARLPDAVLLAEGLSHGRVHAMNLVVEASRLQSQNNEPGVDRPTFDLTQVVTCLLPGSPEEEACVLPGCVVLLSAEQTSVARLLTGQRLQVALISGDLSHSFRHLGFSGPAGLKRVSHAADLSSSSKEAEWAEKLVALLLRLEVNLVLVSGLVDENAALRCRTRGVLLVERVKAPVLKALARETGAVPVTYATQLSRHCVGSGATVSIWRDLGSRAGTASTAVNISTAARSVLVTAVLTGCMLGKLPALEDQFWACAHRLHHALRDKVLLPGAGVTEILCVHHLLQQVEGAGPNPHRGVVLQLMADGFIGYISTLMVNTGRVSKVSAWTAVTQHLRDANGDAGLAVKFSRRFWEGEQEAAFSPLTSTDASAVKVYDNLSVKQEVWRKALDLVLLVLQTDAEVITGQTNDTQQHLMLL